jgi:hypothetical protein
MQKWVDFVELGNLISSITDIIVVMLLYAFQDLISECEVDTKVRGA